MANVVNNNMSVINELFELAEEAKKAAMEVREQELMNYLKAGGSLAGLDFDELGAVVPPVNNTTEVKYPRDIAHEFQCATIDAAANNIARFQDIIKNELKGFFDETPDGLCSFAVTPEYLIIVYGYDDEIWGHDCTIREFNVWDSRGNVVDSNYLYNYKNFEEKYGVSENNFTFMDMNDFSAILKESSMKIKDILYIGVRVEPKVVERVLLGTPYENYPAKGEAHMTIAYKPNMKILSELLPLLGRDVELNIQGVGDLTEDGVVKNVGLKVKVAAPEALKALMPENNIPHITVWTNDEAGAMAVNTHKCTWKIPLQKTIRGKIAAFNAQNDWAFTVVE